MPVFTDFGKMCGSKLEFQIISGKCPEKTVIEIIAENVDTVDYDSGEDTEIEQDSEGSELL